MESFATDLAHARRRSLSEQHVEALREISEDLRLPAGRVLIRPGEPLDRFVFILEGAIEVFDPRTGEAYLNAHLGPGQFTGEIGFLNGTAATLALRTKEESRVLVAPRPSVLQVLSRVPEMSDIILSVLAGRRRRQVESGDGNLTLVGASESREVRAVESFLSRNKIPFRSLTLDAPEARVLCRDEVCPGVVFAEEGLIKSPTPRVVARLLGLDQGLEARSEVDVLVVGGGPSGVAAAVYAGAEGMSSILVEEVAVGGQAGTSSRVENYMGFPTGISGGDLVWRGEVQAMKFGTRFVRPRRVTHLRRDPDGRYLVKLDDETQVITAAVVIATGVQYRRLPWERLEDFEGNGVYYAATETESRYVRGENVVVVGGGNSAGQAAMFLSRSARHVHVMVRGRSLAASMSDYLTRRLESDPSITLHFETQIEALDGDSALREVAYRSTEGATRLDARGVFVMVGAAPNTGWLSDVVRLDTKGYVLTGEDGGGRSQYETSAPGVFAVGDVRCGSVKRVASAVGEGSVAISSVWKHVQEVKSAQRPK